jgi:biopolymer transport protein ExbD
MITRPLDLASKLRPEPRNFDALFFVNAGLLVLFFVLFGSRFVLAPGLGIDFQLPTVEGANSNARPPTHVITVTNTGQFLTAAGFRKMEELPAWLKGQAKGVAAPTLLVRAEARVPVAVTAKIAGEARRAGFEYVLLAAEEPEMVSAKKP